VINMAMQDPVADLLTCIRNAIYVKRISLKIFSSLLKISIANILYQEKYIYDFKILKINRKSFLEIFFKYNGMISVITKIQRVSKPGFRIYKTVKALSREYIVSRTLILSTSYGIMTDKIAIKMGYGGEVLCVIQ